VIHRMVSESTAASEARKAGRIEVRRVDQPADMEPCEELFFEYGEWVAARLREAYGMVFDPAPLHARFLEEEVPHLLGPRGGLYMAALDGMIAGVGALKPAGKRVAEVKRMYVRTSFRGSGVGRGLLSRVIEDAQALGYERVRLETLEFMQEAHRLYETAGFRYVDRFEGESAIGGIAAIALFMELRLGSSNVGG
jgi:GNAT superfamily N-acetyltransferase